jgi:hypothetical protein
MSKKQIIDVVEQSAIFDGKPDFPPLSMAIYLMNHYSFGGSPQDLAAAANELENPKRYKVRLILEVEELN